MKRIFTSRLNDSIKKCRILLRRIFVILIREIKPLIKKNYIIYNKLYIRIKYILFKNIKLIQRRRKFKVLSRTIFSIFYKGLYPLYKKIINNFYTYIRRFIEYLNRKISLYKGFKISNLWDSGIENDLETIDLGLLPPPPIWSRLFIWILSLGSISLITWSCFAKVEETVTVQGEITTLKPKVIVTAKDPGVVGEIFVVPNQKVDKGDILISYDDDETQLRISSLVNRIEILNKELDVTNKSYFLRFNKLKSQYEHDSNMLQRFRDLNSNGVIPAIDFLRMESNVEQQKINLNIVLADKEKDIINIKKNIQELESLLLELKVKKKRFILKAPITGYILDLKYQSPGQRITTNEEIISIIPDKNLIARVNVPSRLRAPIFINMEAQVEVEAFPSSDFGAIDSKISSLSPTSKVNDNKQKSYMADLKLLSPQSPQLLNLNDLRSGMSITAKMKLRSKPIITNIFTIFSKIIEPISDQS